jgi:hypothetical protein
MKKFVAFLIALPVVVLAGGNAHAATFTNTKIAVTGNGPYTVQFTGSCSLAAGETFGGISGVMTLGTTKLHWRCHPSKWATYPRWRRCAVDLYVYQPPGWRVWLRPENDL